VLRESPWQKNLINDAGLNRLAQAAPACSPGSFFEYCKIGTSATANKIDSGIITFTQAGNTVTASAPIFDIGMVGGLIKRDAGNGSAENYITGYTNPTTVTVADVAAVLVGELFTIWMVHETALQGYLRRSNSYSVLPGDCFSSLAGSTVTMQRTFIFPVEPAPYTVREIGYQQSASGSDDGVVNGRIVLAAPVLVGVTEYLQVVISMFVEYLPVSPSFRADVGTNIDTAGALAIEWLNLWVDDFGVTVPHWQSGASSTSLGSLGYFRLLIANYAQNANPDNASTLAPLGLVGASLIPDAVHTANRGEMEWTNTVLVPVGTETIYGFGLSGVDADPDLLVWDILMSTPEVMVAGNFVATVKWQFLYERQLAN
jgi:hypothetical protein